MDVSMFSKVSSYARYSVMYYALRSRISKS